MSVSVEKALKDLVKTGVYAMGFKQSLKAVKAGEAKAIVIAENTPPELRRKLEYYAKLAGIPIIVYRGTRMDMGLVMGRRHGVSVLAVIDEGSSRILEQAEEA
ncbi:50S ribosomal protein L30e [Aeropyrum pernix]|uniref:Large ribosomal subunit protein eL30 n=1 Tax=Aeropyrum pernix TaxID=56636 RepID=A0A401H8W6_AERPX|nr:50S ribosomal protein L30e [Aeropyrum pernix]GBF08895.1 50S ribosomal protein L30e [Aeropyrum pernix]